MASKTTQSANDVMNWMTRNVSPSWGGATILYASLHVGAVGLGGYSSAPWHWVPFNPVHPRRPRKKRQQDILFCTH